MIAMVFEVLCCLGGSSSSTQDTAIGAACGCRLARLRFASDLARCGGGSVGTISSLRRQPANVIAVTAAARSLPRLLIGLTYGLGLHGTDFYSR